VRVVFLGSPTFALPSVEALLEAGHQIALVVTQPDRPAGRGQKATPSAVATYAQEHNLPLWQTSTLRGPEAEARLRDVDPEAMALAAFGALVPQNILDLAPGGILNVHPSLLPRWRGAAPIQSALLVGDAETGVSIIRLVQALDAGPILLQERLPIAPEDDYLSLEPRLARLGAHLLVRAFADRPEPRPQSEQGVTFSRRVTRDDARIDWARPAEEIWRQVRALRAWPQAFTTFDGRVLKVLRAWPGPSDWRGAPGSVVATRDPRVSPNGADVPVVHTGHGSLRLDEIVLEGRRPQTGSELVRGYPRIVGAVLGGSS
jgi:methionyl-tRNA formyltransferase